MAVQPLAVCYSGLAEMHFDRPARGPCCRFWITQREPSFTTYWSAVWLRGAVRKPWRLSSPAASSRGPVLGLGLYSWTALPLQASAGSKLHSAARGLTLRPMSDCGRCGFRWRWSGRSSLHTRNGFSAECLGDVSDTATETQVAPWGPCA